MGIKVGLKSKGEEEDWSRGLVCIRTEEYELYPPFTASIFFKANLVKKLQEFSPPCALLKFIYSEKATKF